MASLRFPDHFSVFKFLLNLIVLCPLKGLVCEASTIVDDFGVADKQLL